MVLPLSSGRARWLLAGLEDELRLVILQVVGEIGIFAVRWEVAKEQESSILVESGHRRCMVVLTMSLELLSVTLNPLATYGTILVRPLPAPAGKMVVNNIEIAVN